MSILRRFWRHEVASSFESLALALSVIAVLSVASADLLHHASKKDGIIVRALAKLRAPATPTNAHDMASRGGIDYTPTGTILGLRRAATLNPCTAPAK